MLTTSYVPNAHSVIHLCGDIVFTIILEDPGSERFSSGPQKRSSWRRTGWNGLREGIAYMAQHGSWNWGFWR
jgi:hypothetical protein